MIAVAQPMEESPAPKLGSGRRGDKLRFPICECLDASYKDSASCTANPWAELSLHDETQDTDCEAWKLLLTLVDAAAEDGRETFAPLRDLSEDQVVEIITLPPTIARLTRVKHLHVVDSWLLRIPPEIGELVSLETFDAYGSHRLHWVPYELSQCPKLRDTKFSTRALYGNHKYRPPFPRLPQLSHAVTPECCSVCRGPFTHDLPVQVWISLRLGTDVLPLLVHACSEDCIDSLPAPAPNYVASLHQGGLELRQPGRWF